MTRPWRSPAVMVPTTISGLPSPSKSATAGGESVELGNLYFHNNWPPPSRQNSSPVEESAARTSNLPSPSKSANATDASKGPPDDLYFHNTFPSRARTA